MGQTRTAGGSLRRVDHVRSCASFSTFPPRVLEFWVVITSALSLPRTAVTTTSEDAFEFTTFGTP